MLTIRMKQMNVFTDLSLKRYETSMVVHLNKYFSEECDALGEERTRHAIRYALKRAESYEIVSERDVCIYTDLMFAFGKDFDKDPQLPWAGTILNEESLKGEPSQRIDRLYDVARENIEHAQGINAGTEV
jgi:hypothetical protein